MTKKNYRLISILMLVAPLYLMAAKYFGNLKFIKISYFELLFTGVMSDIIIIFAAFIMMFILYTTYPPKK